jgi:hypothetical protein
MNQQIQSLLAQTVAKSSNTESIFIEPSRFHESVQRFLLSFFQDLSYRIHIFFDAKDCIRGFQQAFLWHDAQRGQQRLVKPFGESV